MRDDIHFLSHLDDWLLELSQINDPTLVLIKGHLLVEQVLFLTLAMRLQRPSETLPSMKFPTAVDLVFEADESRLPLLRFNSLRNVVAHQLAGMDSADFRSHIAKFGFEWPAGKLERCLALENIVHEAYWRTVTQFVAFSREYCASPLSKASPLKSFPERDEYFESTEAVAANRLAFVSTIRKMMVTGGWDAIVEGWRPGWRAPSA